MYLKRSFGNDEKNKSYFAFKKLYYLNLLSEKWNKLNAFNAKFNVTLDSVLPKDSYIF